MLYVENSAAGFPQSFWRDFFFLRNISVQHTSQECPCQPSSLCSKLISIFAFSPWTQKLPHKPNKLYPPVAFILVSRPLSSLDPLPWCELVPHTFLIWRVSKGTHHHLISFFFVWRFVSCIFPWRCGAGVRCIYSAWQRVCAQKSFVGWRNARWTSRATGFGFILPFSYWEIQPLLDSIKLASLQYCGWFTWPSWIMTFSYVKWYHRKSYSIYFLWRWK